LNRRQRKRAWCLTTLQKKSRFILAEASAICPIRVIITEVRASIAPFDNQYLLTEAALICLLIRMAGTVDCSPRSWIIGESIVGVPDRRSLP
jgi:hypothetical protein